MVLTILFLLVKNRSRIKSNKQVGNVRQSNLLNEIFKLYRSYSSKRITTTVTCFTMAHILYYAVQATTTITHNFPEFSMGIIQATTTIKPITFLVFMASNWLLYIPFKEFQCYAIIFFLDFALLSTSSNCVILIGFVGCEII